MLFKNIIHTLLKRDVLIPLILAIIFTSSSPWWIPYLISKIEFVRQKYIPLWLAIFGIIIIVVSIILLIYSFNFFKNKKQSIAVWSIGRPRSGNEIELPFEISNLKYIAYIPDQSIETDEYVWLDGPFCPNCKLELKRKGKLKQSWHCEGCGKSFGIFKKSESEEKDFVKDIVFTKVFRERKFQNL